MFTSRSIWRDLRQRLAFRFQHAAKRRRKLRPIAAAAEQLEDRTLLASTLNITEFSENSSSISGKSVQLKRTSHTDYAPRFVDVSGGKWLILTADFPGKVPSQGGTAIVDPGDNPVRSFKWDLKYTITSDNGNPSDGFAFGYAPLSGNAFGPFGETSRGGLWVNLNVFTREYSIWWKTSRIHRQTGVSVGSLTGTRTLGINVTSAGKLTVTHSSLGTVTKTLSNWSPGSSWRFGAGASIGDNNAAHIIKNWNLRQRTNDTPTISVSPSSNKTYSDNSTRSFSWTANDEEKALKTVSVKRNGGTIYSQTDTNGEFGLVSASTTVPRTPGSYTYVVTAQDRGGAVSSTSYQDTKTSQKTVKITIVDDDISGPSISLGGSSGSQSHALDQFFTWNVSDPSGIYSRNVRITGPGLDQTITNQNSGRFDLNSYGPGKYTILVSATDNDNDRSGDRKSSSKSRSVTITNAAPVAIATVDELQPLEGQLIHFDGSASSDSDAPSDIVDYTWEFGDGTIVKGITATHAYGDQGRYSVRLTTTDRYGASGTATLTIDALNAAPMLPDLSFFTGQVGEPVAFAAIASDPGTDEQLEYMWDFGNGSSVSGVGLSSPPNAYVSSGRYSGSVQVTDKDGASDIQTFSVEIGPPVSFTLAERVIDETVSTFVIDAELAAELSDQVVVPLIITGTARDGQDYQLSSSELIIEPNTTSIAVAVDLLNDSLSEGTETIVVTMGLPTGASHGEIAQQIIQIIDDDPLPMVSMVGSYHQAEEGDQVIISAQLSERAGRDVIVALDPSHSTAVEDEDYAFESGRAEVVIPEGALQGFLILDILDDNLGERTERIQLRLSDSEQAIVSTNPIDSLVHTILIPQNDSPSVYFSSLNSATPVAGRVVDEDSGLAAFRVRLSNPTVEEVTVPLTLFGNLPSSAYSLRLANGAAGSLVSIGSNQYALTIPGGQTGAILVVDLVDNNIANQGTRRLSLRMNNSVSNASLGSSRTYSLRVREDDVLKVSLTRSSLAVYEGDGSFEITAQLSGATDQRIAVPFSIHGDAKLGSDVELTQHSFIFNPGDPLTQTMHVTLVDDADEQVDERRETITFQLKEARLERYVLGTRDSIDVHIFDDDPGIYLVMAETTFAEDGAPLPLKVITTNVMNEDIIVPLEYKTSKYRRNATLGIDFAGPSEVVIPAGQRSASVDIIPIDDDNVELTEDVRVSLGKPEVGRILERRPDGEERKSFRRLTLRDDDAAPNVALSRSGFVRAYESSGSSQILTVSLNRINSEDTVIRPYWNEGTAKIGADFTVEAIDFPGLSNPQEEIVIPAGNRSASVRIRFVDDKVQEADEQIKMGIHEPSNATIAGPSEVSWTIVNDDGPSTVTSSAVVTSDQTYDAGTGQFIPVGTLGIGDDGTYIPSAVGPLSPDLLGFAADEPPPDTLPVGYIGLSTSNGLIDGGLAFFDANFNGVVDFLDLNGDGVQQANEPDEPTTDSAVDGSARLVIDSAFDLNGDGVIRTDEGRMVAVGGQEIATGLPIFGRLSAAAGHYAMTPLTTLVEELVRRHGMSLTDAETRVESALGLPDVELGTLIAQYAALSGDPDAAKVFATQQIVSDTLTQISRLFSGFSGAPPAGFFSELVWADIADKLAAPDAFLDLTDPLTVDNVIQGVAFATGFDLGDEVSLGAANVIAEGNLAISVLPVTPGIDYLKAVTRIKSVAQTVVADALQGVTAGTNNIAAVETAFTGVNLQALHDGATIGNVVPPDLTVSHVGAFEGDDGTTILEFRVRLTGESTTPVSVAYSTQDHTATAASGDYEATSGTLNWAPGDNTDQSVFVTVNSDGDFELDEVVLLMLSEPSNAAIRTNFGYGWILNDDAFSYTAPDSASNDLLLSIDGSEVTLTENGAVVLRGPLAAPVPVTIRGGTGCDNRLIIDLVSPGPIGTAGITFIGTGPQDSLFVLDEASDTIVRTIVGPDSGAYLIDGTTISYTGVRLAEDSVTPTIMTPATSQLEGETVSFSLLSAATTDSTTTTYLWTATLDDKVVATSSGDAFSFTAPENGEYVISVTASGLDQPTATERISYSVANADPELSIADISDDPIEGSEVEIILTATDPALANDPLSYNWAVFDPSGIEIALGTTGEVRFTPADDGSYTLTAMVSDDDGSSTSISVTIEVANVVPTVTLSGETTIEEGALYRADLTATDPGADTITSSRIEWGDGTFSNFPNGINPEGLAHAYENPGVYTVTASVQDEDGTWQAVNTIEVSVADVPPIVDTGPDASAIEGTAFTGSGSIVIPGFGQAGFFDTYTATVDYGDGLGGAPLSIADDGTFILDYVYAENGLYTVTVTATDDDGTSTSDTLDVSVANAAPVITSLNAPVIDEDGTAVIEGSFTDLGTLDTHSVVISWGDGTSFDATVDRATLTFTASYQYLDDNPTDTSNDDYTIGVTVTDDDIGRDVASTTVIVNNVAPVIETVNAPVIDEDGTATITGTFTDVGKLDTHSVVISWGDGTTSDATVDPTSLTFTASYQYLDDKPTDTASDVYEIGVTLTDDDFGTATANTSVTVNNLNPVIVSVSVNEIDENGTATINGSFTDVGTLDTHTVVIDWGDGTTSNATVDPIARTFTADHQYVDDNPSNTTQDTYLVNATVTDDDAGEATTDTTVTVNNIAPIIQSVSAPVIDEDGIAKITGNFTDVGTLDTHTVEISWGDGTTSSAVVDAATRTFTADHVYLDDNLTGTTGDVYDVSVVVTDDDTGVDTASTTVTVNNVNPVIVGLNAPVIDENGTATINGSFTDVGTLDTHTVVIDWGDGTISDATVDPIARTFTASRHYLDDNPTGTSEDVYHIDLTLSDDDGGTAVATTSAIVQNVAPSIVHATATHSQIDDASQDGHIAIAGQFFDPGTLDTHVATIDWGDGSAVQFMTLTPNTREFAADHLYADGGIYQISLTIQDDDGGVDTWTTQNFVEGLGIVDGVLYLIGTEGDDHVKLRNWKNTSAILIDAKFDQGPNQRRERRLIEADQIDGVFAYLAAGNDHYSGRLAIPQFVDGADGNDYIAGGSRSDILLGGFGNDVLTARGGNDVLLGGAGNDVIFGGQGNEIILGGFGNDLLVGGKGDDILLGGRGFDILLGNRGDDVLVGVSQIDLLLGGAGDDEIQQRQPPELEPFSKIDSTTELLELLDVTFADWLSNDLALDLLTVQVTFATRVGRTD